MLDFCPGAQRSSQLTARIDGIDRNFLSGNTRLPLLARRCSPFPSRLGAMQVCGGLALAHTNYSNVCLGIVTHFGSSSTGPGTLAPRVGWGGVQNPSYVLQQVSNYLDLLDVYYNDIDEGNRAHAGPCCLISTLHPRG